MKQLFLIPALVLTLSPLGAANIGWPDIFGSGSPTSTPVDGGVFGGAQPKAAPDDTEPQPEPQPLASISISETGLLEFVLQQAYVGISSDEADKVRAVLAPQYATLAQYLQGAFTSAEPVQLPQELLADPAPVTNGDSMTSAGGPGVTVTQAMAVVAVAAILNDGPAGRDSYVEPPNAPQDELTLQLMLGSGGGFNLGTSVPEPATWLLAAAGLTLASVRRFR